MNFDEPDPEVVADLQLRASSQRDRSRSRTAQYDWSPPVIVGKWKCRVPACATFVDVPEVAMERFCAFNDRLRQTGESPLDMNALLYCERCAAEFKRTASDRRRGQVERMRVAIIELKATQKPERQRELLDQLRIWHHPDVDGLANWLRDRDKAAGGKKRREL